MKAARIHAFGGSKKVRIETIALPRIRKSTALVRVRAAAVNPVDWMVRERIYNPKGADKVPLTLGQDFAGIIEEIAPARAEAWARSRPSSRSGRERTSSPPRAGRASDTSSGSGWT